MFSEDIPSFLGILSGFLVLGWLSLWLASSWGFRRDRQTSVALAEGYELKNLGDEDIPKDLKIPYCDYRHVRSPKNITFSELSMKIGDSIILRNITGELRAGEITAIMGVRAIHAETLNSLHIPLHYVK